MILSEPYFAGIRVYDTVSIPLPATVIYICFVIYFSGRKFFFSVSKTVTTNSFSRKNIAEIAFFRNPSLSSCFSFCEVVIEQLMMFFYIIDNRRIFGKLINSSMRNGSFRNFNGFCREGSCCFFRFRLILCVGKHQQNSDKSADEKEKENFNFFRIHTKWFQDSVLFHSSGISHTGIGVILC